MPTDAAAARLAAFFADFAPADLARLGEHYREDAQFKDPFNEVRGLGAVRAIYAHMFEQLEAPRFTIHEILCGSGSCVLTWTFHFRRRGAAGPAWEIRGASHLVLDDDGRIAVHRDYWDAAEELYEKLPLLGSLMRWLRRRLATPVGGAA